MNDHIHKQLKSELGLQPVKELTNVVNILELLKRKIS